MEIFKYPANFITSLRIVGTIGLLFTVPFSKVFYVLYTFSGITDVLDGAVARITGTASSIGAELDSIADLIFYLVMMISIINTVEYNEYKHGTREEAIIASIRPFFTKMGSALVVVITSVTYIIFNVTGYTNQISDLESAAASGLITEAEKLSSIESVLSGVQLSQSNGLLLCMVVIPFVSDQPVNARQVEKLGLGKVLDYKAITANALRDTAFSVMEDRQIQENLRKIQDEIANAPGNRGAVKIIEEYFKNNT